MHTQNTLMRKSEVITFTSTLYVLYKYFLSFHKMKKKKKTPTKIGIGQKGEEVVLITITMLKHTRVTIIIKIDFDNLTVPCKKKKRGGVFERFKKYR